jgi:hypothetical protein
VIKVRRASLSDYPAIAAFIREAYGELSPFKVKDRWEWQFVNSSAGVSLQLILSRVPGLPERVCHLNAKPTVRDGIWTTPSGMASWSRTAAKEYG